MQTQDHKKIVSSGPESHGAHLCHKCGWAFPNPHPSARHRRAHKRVCGTIQGQKTRLDGSDDEHLSDDDSKTPSLTAVEKSAGMSITRRSSSGVGSRSSRSTRSDEDVFSDAVTEFVEVPAVAGSNVVRETADMPQDFSEDVRITELVVEKPGADAGDLYPVNSDNGTQVLDVECPIPEIEREETEMPSAHHSSTSTLVSVSNSGFDTGEKEGSSNENILQSYEVAAVLEATLDKNSEDSTVKSLEAVVLPQKVNGDSKEFIPAGAAMEVMEQIGNQGDGCGDKDDCSPKFNFVGQTNGSEEGLVEAALEKKSGDITYIPAADNAGKTSETLSMSQKVNGDNLEIHANATMEVKERQGDGFDANNDCFPAEADFVGQTNRVEEDSNVEAGNSLGMFDGHDSCSNSVHLLAVPGVLPLKEHSEGILEDYEDHKTEKLPNDVTIDLTKEVECVEHGKVDVNREIFLSTSLAEPSESPNRSSKDIISEVSHKEDNSAQELSVEKEMGRIETCATDADICKTSSVVALHPDKEGNEIVTPPQEQNSLIFIDANLQSVMDDSGNLAHSIKPVQDDSEYDKKDAQFFDALEADSTKVAEETLPLSSDSGDYDVRSREVEDFSESILTVAQSDELMDDKVEVQKDEEHGSGVATSESSEASLLKCNFQMKELQDSEPVVKDLGNSSEQMVGGERGNLLGSTAISDIDNNANMTEQTHNGENGVLKASDSVDVGLFNSVMNNDAQQGETEVSEDAKEVENFGEKVSGEECLGKVDLGLISDNDVTVNLTQNTASKTNAGVHVEAVSAVVDRLTKVKDGNGSDFVDDNVNLVGKLEEAGPEVDVQVDSISQTDSLEGNWGSVSVLSAFSDAPVATETGSQRSQSSVKVENASLQLQSNNGKSDVFEPPYITASPEQKGDGSGQKEGAPEAQTSEKPQEKAALVRPVASATNESSGTESKRNEEIIAKVTNWSTASGKQHMPLKSFLGEASPNNAKDNRPLEPQETEKIMIDTKEAAGEAAREEMPKEWNSPAKYPTNIKREKGKVRSRPYWAPFVCCSSVQTS